MPAVAHAVIAAAGKGTRLGYGVPKCLLEVAGKPLIEWQLRLLATVEDVRGVVGYREFEVMEAVRRIRSDAVFVRNPRFAETTTQDSYSLGARYLPGSCLFLDADIWFEPATFAEFLRRAPEHPLAIGITRAGTDDAVYAAVDEDGTGTRRVTRFSRREPLPFEWANILWAPAALFTEGGGAVFERLAAELPAPALEVRSFEVDTEADLHRARSAAGSAPA